MNTPLVTLIFTAFKHATSQLIGKLEPGTDSDLETAHNPPPMSLIDKRYWQAAPTVRRQDQ